MFNWITKNKLIDIIICCIIQGSESAPSPPPSKPYMTSTSGRSPVPLERLLEEGVPDDEALDTASLALTPEQEIADLRRRLLAQQQRLVCVHSKATLSK